MTLGPFLGFLCYVLGTKLGGVLLFRMCFEKGVWLFVSCFGSCLIAAASTCVHGDQVMVSIVGVLHTNSSWFYSPFCGANIQLFP